MQNTKNLISQINNGEFDERLLDVYVDEHLLTYQKNRYIKALEKFVELYGDADVEIYSAPGRSEVGGNHTDHQHGQVLACSINLDAIAIVAPTENNTIKVISDSYDIAPIDLASLDKADKEEGTSESLIRGVAAKLKSEGYKVGGFNAFITSDVLVGAGMSSSAAFEVVIGTILSGLYNDMNISPVFIAQASQYAENEYFGKPCGLMDQMASSVGNLINIDFKDPANPVIKRINVDFGSFSHDLCIVDTKGSHADLTPEYAAIPPEMKKVAAYFGKEFLREVEFADFLENIAVIREKAGDRAILRALHFFNDHSRVGEQVAALEAGDFDLFKKLIIESGNSSFKYLQNVYPSSDPTAQGVSIGLAMSEQILGDDGAMRVHGGGFAGTIQVFVPSELTAHYKTEIEKVFGEDSCHVLKVRKYGGMKVC